MEFAILNRPPKNRLTIEQLFYDFQVIVGVVQSTDIFWFSFAYHIWVQDAYESLSKGIKEN